MLIQIKWEVGFCSDVNLATTCGGSVVGSCNGFLDHVLVIRW